MSQKKTKMRLGELLIEQGVLSEESLNRALEKQKKEGGMLGELLLKMGLVKEEDIVLALARQFTIPYLPVQNFDINAKLLALVPLELVKKYLLIPVDRINNVLTLVMTDPTNDYARQDVEQATGLRVQALVGTVTEVTAAIRKHYKIKDGLVPGNDASANISQVSFHEATRPASENAKMSKGHNHSKTGDR